MRTEEQNVFSKGRFLHSSSKNLRHCMNPAEKESWSFSSNTVLTNFESHQKSDMQAGDKVTTCRCRLIQITKQTFSFVLLTVTVLSDQM